MSQNRKRFEDMRKNLSELDRQTEKLDEIIMQSSIKRLDLLSVALSDLDNEKPVIIIDAGHDGST